MSRINTAITRLLGKYKGPGFRCQYSFKHVVHRYPDASDIRIHVRTLSDIVGVLESFQKLIQSSGPELVVEY